MIPFSGLSQFSGLSRFSGLFGGDGLSPLNRDTTVYSLQNPRFVVLGESPKDLYEYLQSDEMLFVRNQTIVSPTLGDQTGSKTFQKGKSKVYHCVF